MLAFDLDPGAPADLVDCCRVALRVRDLFGPFGLEGFPKISGCKGLQVYVPLNTKVDYEQTNPFAKAVAQLLEQQTPDGVVSKMDKVDRRGQGLRRLEPEPPAEDDDRRLLAASARATDRLDPGHWGEVERVADERRRKLARFETGARPRPGREQGDLFAPVPRLEAEAAGLWRSRPGAGTALRG